MDDTQEEKRDFDKLMCYVDKMRRERKIGKEKKKKKKKVRKSKFVQSWKIRKKKRKSQMDKKATERN